MVTPVGDWWPAGQLGVQYSSQGLQDSWGMRRSWSSAEGSREERRGAREGACGARAPS